MAFPLTQLAPALSIAAPFQYKYLEGDWPVLDLAPDVSGTLEKIKENGTGNAVSMNMSYLSLGHFFISTELLGLHPLQRQIDNNHVMNLKADFQRMGIDVVEHPGVIIGLGKGWMQMKKPSHMNHIMITSSSPHIHHLQETPGGPIGLVIRGGHRTTAITSLSKENTEYYGRSFWYYNVLVPGMFPVVFKT
jgi:hypothetical protein